jgi:hypothetical protein
MHLGYKIGSVVQRGPIHVANFGGGHDIIHHHMGYQARVASSKLSGFSEFFSQR